MVAERERKVQSPVEFRCHTGLINKDQAAVSLTSCWKKPIWSIPRQNILQISQTKASFITDDVTIVSALGTYELRYTPKKQVPAFLALFTETEEATIDAEIERLSLEIERRRSVLKPHS
jgi:hypothetical protein